MLFNEANKSLNFVTELWYYQLKRIRDLENQTSTYRVWLMQEFTSELPRGLMPKHTESESFIPEARTLRNQGLISESEGAGKTWKVQIQYKQKAKTQNKLTSLWITRLIHKHNRETWKYVRRDRRTRKGNLEEWRAILSNQLEAVSSAQKSEISAHFYWCRFTDFILYEFSRANVLFMRNTEFFSREIFSEQSPTKAPVSSSWQTSEKQISLESQEPWVLTTTMLLLAAARLRGWCEQLQSYR